MGKRLKLTQLENNVPGELEALNFLANWTQEGSPGPLVLSPSTPSAASASWPLCIAGTLETGHPSPA